MTSAVTTMPSSISSGSTQHRRSDSEAGTRGFTAVNITPPQSRGTHEPRTSTDKTNGAPESSATSPDVSPRHGTASAGRNGTDAGQYSKTHDPAQHKRRRSVSSEQELPSPRRYDYNPPKKLETQQQHMADRALHVLDSTNQQPPNSYYSTTPSTQERPSVYPYDRPYSAHNATSEGRLAEPFSRDPSEHHYSASPANGLDHKRAEDGKDQPQVLQTGQKRKRNFSNRTKTGCITCRNRKKKCDEGRPYCNNCLRGGFTCAGYNHTRPGNWSKPTAQKQPIPLQSKENDESGPYENNITPVSANPSSAEASQIRSNVAGDGHDQSRPQYAPNSATSADSRPPYTGQQQHQQPPQWPQHPPQQHGPSPQNSYPPEHLPPLSDLPRPDQQHQQPPPPQQQHPPPPRQDCSTTPQREMSRPPTQAQSGGPHPNAPAPHWQQQHPPQQPPPQQPPPQQPPPPAHHAPQAQPPAQHQPPYQPPSQQQEYGARPNPYPPRIDTSQPQYSQSRPGINTANTANTASASYSSYEQKAGSKLFTNEDVERSRMLRGALYNYFDKTLHNERQRCANALLRYNNACQLGSGVSDQELQNMLLKVFIPKKDQTHSFLAANPLEGSLGPGVKIEPGFRCTYGYNIRIYDNVFIGENTRIDDSARVDIGSRTWIGANVTILTNDVNKDSQNRKGTDGQQCMAHGVSIGSEVVIGTGAVIMPGRRLGKGSTVEPFAIVKQDLADYETQRVYEGPRMAANVPAYGMMG